MEIKKAKRSDFKEIAKIYSQEFSKPPYSEPWDEKTAFKKIKIFSKYCDIWKVVYEKEIIGFIVVNPNQFYPRDVAFGEEIAIKEKYQRRGVGSKLLEKIMEIYKEKGFKSFMGIANKKSKAFKLYKKLGILESKKGILIEKKLK